jgi:hypothetical protein
VAIPLLWTAALAPAGELDAATPPVLASAAQVGPPTRASAPSKAGRIAGVKVFRIVIARLRGELTGSRSQWRRYGL